MAEDLMPGGGMAVLWDHECPQAIPHLRQGKRLPIVSCVNAAALTDPIEQFLSGYPSRSL